MSTSLNDLALKYGTDKARRPNGSGHGYTRIYEELFRDIRYEQFNLLEIGVNEGASLRMWRDWFPNAQIYGVDIRPEYMIEDEPRIATRCMDIRKPRRPWLRAARPFRIVIDDGNHIANCQYNAFTLLWPMLEPGGFYIIEDLHGFPINGKGRLLWRMHAILRRALYPMLRLEGDNFAAVRIYPKLLIIMKESGLK
jgi:hypothetical protein